jgi:hypothetical protein
MAMSEQPSHNWNNVRSGWFNCRFNLISNCCLEHAVSNPVMIPQGASPRSVGEQSGIYHAMIEDVLKESLQCKSEIKYLKINKPPVSYETQLNQFEIKDLIIIYPYNK